jgi:hypothetical protein
VCEKHWGKITAGVYTQYILLAVYQFYCEVVSEVGYMRAILMEHNASVYIANLICSYHTYYSVIRME